MKYTTAMRENALLIKKKAINDYIDLLSSKLGSYVIDIKKHENAPDFIDLSLAIGNHKFLFVFTHSKHEVELSNNKYWKILRSKTTKMGDTKKRNPSSWIPDKFESDYYVFPVLHPRNEMKYNRNIMIIDNYEKTIDFVIKKVRKKNHE